MNARSVLPVLGIVLIGAMIGLVLHVRFSFSASEIAVSLVLFLCVMAGRTQRPAVAELRREKPADHEQEGRRTPPAARMPAVAEQSRAA